MDYKDMQYKHISQGHSNEDAESHLLYSNNLMNSQGLVEEEKCASFCLTSAQDAHLWDESIHPVDNDWINLQELFH